MLKMMSKSAKAFRPEGTTAGNSATGIIILQILRICTVITLATMGIAYWVFIIKVDKSRSYFVFECVSLFFNSALCFILILSEFPLVRLIEDYFRSSWPVLSELHGVAWLGGAMLLLGCNIFGNLNTPAYDSDTIAPALFKLTLAAGVLAFTFGVLNIVCAFVWRNGKDGITSRDIRANGALATGRPKSLPDYASSSGSGFGSMASQKKGPAQSTSSSTTTSGPVDLESGYGEKGHFSPVAPGIQRPDTAMHPINLGTGSETSSRYSDPDISRF